MSVALPLAALPSHRLSLTNHYIVSFVIEQDCVAYESVKWESQVYRKSLVSIVARTTIVGLLQM